MTRRRDLVRLAAGAYALVDVAVLMAPSVVLAVVAEKGGLPDSHGTDLLIASAVLGAGHATVAYARLVDETRTARRDLDVWIAAVDALVVLALGATLLLVAVLGGFATQHAVLVNRGWPVVWLWIGVQLVAIALAELTGRSVFRWLERAVPGSQAPAPAGGRAAGGATGGPPQAPVPPPPAAGAGLVPHDDLDGRPAARDRPTVRARR